ncbi:MAG: DNA glycosylase, partial [Verrucomicrobiota bacterium]
MPAETPWTPFSPVPGVPPLTPTVLAETLDGGQAFRWHRETTPSELTVWLGVWAGHLTRLRLAPEGSLEFSAPASLAPHVASALPRYLATDRDWSALTDSLPWRSDVHMARCLATFPGLRILRQPFGETLLGFLCSATKQIV